MNFELSTPGLTARAQCERPAHWHCLTSCIAGRMAGVGLKNLVKYLPSKFSVAEHLSHFTVKRHRCGVWLKTTTL